MPSATGHRRIGNRSAGRERGETKATDTAGRGCVSPQIAATVPGPDAPAAEGASPPDRLVITGSAAEDGMCPVGQSLMRELVGPYLKSQESLKA